MAKSAIYKVRSPERLQLSDPLHVSRFYESGQRTHQKKMQDRQDLILYLAHIHSTAVKSGIPLGFCRIPMRLMTLHEWVYDYRIAFDRFFDVVELGYNLGEKNEVSIVIPKKVSFHTKRKFYYLPPVRPIGDLVSSRVYIQQGMKDHVLERLKTSGRVDLYAPVEWLLQLPVVDFLFARSGKLQQRDTSVWPVCAVETWPAWLREALFGRGIDIEAAYTQFLISHVRVAYADEPHMIEQMFPDIVRSIEDKVKFRLEICTDILGLVPDEENISIVKKICMSLANGSRCTPAIMLNGISITKDIVIKEIEDQTPGNLIRIGERLAQISRQYSQARKLICTKVMGVNPSRENQKKVFASYFEWERIARYKIWEAVGRHGIMVHDGIDGIPLEHWIPIPELVKQLDIRLT